MCTTYPFYKSLRPRRCTRIWSSKMTTKINYISAIPGLGKTKFSVSQLARCVREKTNYAMYVAPTVELLLEVESYLKQELSVQEMTQVRIFHSKDDKVGTVSHSVKMALTGGKDQHGRIFKEPKLGMVMLVTHATFMNLKNLPGSEIIDLYFDEARKCVSQSHSIKLTSKKQKYLVLKALSLERHGDTRYFKVTSDISKQDYLKLMAKTTWEPRQRRAVDALVKAAHNKRFDTYVSGVKDKSLKIFEVTMPSKIFDGFKSVTLMSAFFEDSQMYHLLKMAGTELIDVSYQAVPNYKERHQELIARYRKVSVIPLLNQQQVLSKSHLSGFLISDDREDLLTKLQELGFESKGRLRVLKEYALDSRSYTLSDQDKKALKLLADNKEDFEFVPLEWMLRETKAVIKSWAKSEGIKKIKSPLLIVNKKYERDAERLASDYKIISTQVHGLNKYYQHEVVVFLAAINPTPDLCRFYSTYLPEYNIEKDHVADVCIQCVCRGSVRDTNTSKPTLVVVSDLGIMNHVHEKMFKRPTLLTNKMPAKQMIASNLSGASKTLRVKGVSKVKTLKERTAEWRSKGSNREKQILRNTISRYKKQLREGKGKNVEAKLADTQQKLEAILAEA